MKRVLVFFLISTACFAQTPSVEVSDSGPFSIDAGDEIDVIHYDAPAHRYRVETTQDPTILPIYVTPENLARAVHILNLEALKQKPTAIIGHDYLLDDDLLVQWGD